MTHLDIKAINCIIFDWDGTVIDSMGPLVNSFMECCDNLNIKRPLLNRLKAQFGHKPEYVLQELFPEQTLASSDFIDKFLKHFRDIYQNQELTLIPGAIETLKTLKNNGFTLCIATNKNRELLEKELYNTQSKKFFSHSICSDECEGKPSPDMLLRLADISCNLTSNCIMVGDHHNDIIAAKDANMHCIAVLSGSHSHEQLEKNKPTAILNDITELYNLLIQR